MKTPGDRIRQGRLGLELTQPQLAELVGVSKGTISMWETGVTNPKGTNLLNLCAVLKLSPDHIVSGEVSMPAAGPIVRSELPGSDPLLEEASELLTALPQEKRQAFVDLLRSILKE